MGGKVALDEGQKPGLDLIDAKPMQVQDTLWRNTVSQLACNAANMADC